MGEKLDVIRVDGEPIRVSDDFVRQLTSKTCFIESLKAIDFKLDNEEIINLKIEISELKSEVSELKQKLEEK